MGYSNDKFPCCKAIKKSIVAVPYKTNPRMIFQLVSNAKGSNFKFSAPSLKKTCPIAPSKAQNKTNNNILNFTSIKIHFKHAIKRLCE